MAIKKITSFVLVLAVLSQLFSQHFFANALSPSDISNQVFHFDTKDINWNWNYEDEPDNNDLISELIDKVNSSTWTQLNSSKQAIYKKYWINWNPSLYFDWIDDLYTISDNILINSWTWYSDKSFSIVFNTNDDISSIQSIYEQWASDKWYWLQINSWFLYAWVWNTVDWVVWEQYKVANLWPININTTYNVIMNHSWDSGSNDMSIYLNWNPITTLTNVWTQSTHGQCTIPGWFDCYIFSTPGSIWLWATFNDTLKMDDNSSLIWEEINHFKGHIWELLSWNQVLTTIEIDWLYDYHNERWYIENPSSISSWVFHFDAMDIDWDWDFDDNPNDWWNISSWVDKFNWYNAGIWISPSYEAESIKAQSWVVFDWSEYLGIANQSDINTSTYDEKSFAIIFKTWDDISSMQTIYEQWGGTRWYSMQIENWKFYAWVWNNSEWWAWNQYKVLSVDIYSNTEYRVVMVQDSTDAVLSNRTFELFINWTSMWVLNNVDFQRWHSWWIELWESDGSRKLSDSSSLWTGFNFIWNIWEFISWNHALTNNEVDSINTYFYNKWLSEDVDLSPIINFINPFDVWVQYSWNFDIDIQYDDQYLWSQVDTNSDVLELYRWNWSSWWSDISWTYVDFLNKDVDTFEASYPVVWIIDWKYKLIYSISNQNWKVWTEEILFHVWELLPQNVSNIVYHYDAQDTDGDYILNNEWNNNLDPIWTLSDKINGFDASQTNWSQIPIYEVSSINWYPSILFDGVDDVYNISNQWVINTNSTFSEKSFASVFKTGDDVNTFQTIYEQWWTVRWYSFIVHNWHVYAWVWNLNEWDSWHQYKSVDMWVAQPNTVYFAMIVQDSQSAIDSENQLKIYLNGNLASYQDHTDQQYAHAWSIWFWAVIGDTVRASDNTPISGDWYYFDWNIWEHISWNHALDQAEINWIQEYFSNKRWVVLFYEKYPIPTPTSEKNPIYRFITNSTGSLSYWWSCKSITTNANIWENTINFDTDWAWWEMSDWLYDDCTITLTDINWFDHVLNVSPFEIISSSIYLTEVTPVSSPSNNHFPSYTFNSPISWTINYFWWCSSNDNTAVVWNNTITMNYLSSATYNTCYINVSNATENSEALNISEFIILDDGPFLDSKSIVDDRLYPVWDFSFTFTYHDTGWTGIDLASEEIELYRWNWSSWWSDIAWIYTSNTFLTETWASYISNSIPYWKYKNVFKISSNEWAELVEETIFYVDELEFTISTWSIDMWSLSFWSETFSSEVEVIVKTVWAWFDLFMNKTQIMENYNNDEIIDYNWSEWFWYDQELYSWTIVPISTNELLWSQVKNIHINWERNTYTYRLKLASLITSEQASWNYETRLSFDIELDY